ncbi:MAG: hypothetical protein AAGB26_08300 [Planctomycetota bacterium]
MQESKDDVIYVPLALSCLSQTGLSELNEVVPNLLPTFVAIAWREFCELDFETRVQLVRSTSINNLEDHMNALSQVDMNGKTDAERQHIHDEIEKTRRLYVAALRRFGQT